MPDWEFRDPWFLTLLLLVPLVAWLASRSRSLLSYSNVSLLYRAPKSWRARFANLPALLLAIATVALVISLARPRTPQLETKVSREGVAIMMVIDVSSSMDARDLVEMDRRVNRLHVVKDVFLSFVQGDGSMAGRPDDLIGLVTFARYADSLCPLTLDHGNLATIVTDLEIVTQRSEDGTAVGDGLGLAVERLRRSTAKSRIAILLTDGVTNAGVIEPTKAADLAASSDIKVYCIGAGTNGMAPVPGRDLFGRLTLIPRAVEIDEETLKQIADKTGGRYFRAVDKQALAEIYLAIDQMERVKVSEVRYLQYTEHFGYFIVSGMGLITLSVLLSATVFRKLP